MEHRRWNHNLHHHPLILAAAPAGCARALDVGCGEGVLTRELRAVSARVVGIDLHAPSIAAARSADTADVDYILGDFLEHPFEPASFDLVASVATLHHLEAAAALRRMAGLVRPGGVLVAVGLARSTRIRDLAFDALGAMLTRIHVHLLGKRYWEHSSPQVWPPPLSYAEVRAGARALLPGVKYRRHPLWRYSLVWKRPGA